jgi:hypothetical protein
VETLDKKIDELKKAQSRVIESELSNYCQIKPEFIKVPGFSLAVIARSMVEKLHVRPGTIVTPPANPKGISSEKYLKISKGIVHSFFTERGNS